MTTFLPYADFQRSADVLDPVRRWKQVVECFQTVKVLEQKPGGKKPGWANHPAVLMWRGFVPALKLYTNHMLMTVIREGTHTVTAYQPFDMVGKLRHPAMPPWLGDKRLHSSHRSRLLQKDEAFYSQYGWPEMMSDPQEYFWPTKEGY